MWAELPTNLWANLPTAVRDWLFKEKLRWGAALAGGWGEVAIATDPPHQDLFDTHRNRRKSARLAKPHGVLDLKTWLKLNLS